jgi:hypothetical protein
LSGYYCRIGKQQYNKGKGLHPTAYVHLISINRFSI